MTYTNGWVISHSEARVRSCVQVRASWKEPLVLYSGLLMTYTIDWIMSHSEARAHSCVRVKSAPMFLFTGLLMTYTNDWSRLYEEARVYSCVQVCGLWVVCLFPGILGFWWYTLTIQKCYNKKPKNIHACECVNCKKCPYFLCTGQLMTYTNQWGMLH